MIYATMPICIDFETHSVECEGEGDHVHLLINYPPKISVSKLASSLKAVLARLIRKKGYPSIQNALWGDSL
jgi:putative transposase